LASRSIWSWASRDLRAHGAESAGDLESRIPRQGPDQPLFLLSALLNGVARCVLLVAVVRGSLNRTAWVAVYVMQALHMVTRPRFRLPRMPELAPSQTRVSPARPIICRMPMGRSGPILQLCNLAPSSIVFMLIDVLLRKQPRLGVDCTPRSADVGRLERGL